MSLPAFPRVSILLSLDGIVFIDDSSDLTAGSAIITPVGSPATLFSYTFSLATIGNAINIEGNLLPLLNIVPITDLTLDSISAIVAPSLIASTGSAYTLDRVILTSNSSLGLIIVNFIATSNN